MKGLSDLGFNYVSFQGLFFLSKGFKISARDIYDSQNEQKNLTNLIKLCFFHLIFFCFVFSI